MSQRPIALALFVCEQIIVDEATRAITPVSCFNRRAVPRVPAEPFPFVIFAVLTDGSGELPIEAQIIRLDTDEVIYQAESMIRFQNPLQEIRFRLRFASLSFPIAGSYEVLLLVDHEVLARRRIQIVVREEEQ